MARARLLKPGFFANEDLAELPPFGRLLFAGIWTLVDREGRMLDRPKRIKGALFPYDNVEVDDLLAQLTTLGFVARYEVAGERYIQVVNFLKHQTPHVREPASALPAQGATERSMMLDLGEPESGPSVAVAVSDPVAETETVPEAEAESARNAPGAAAVLDLGIPDPWRELRSEFENTFGLIGGEVVQEAREYARTVPASWFTAALTETREKADRPSWKYAKTILDRCLSEGQPPGPRPQRKPQAADGSARSQFLNRAAAARGA